MAFPLLSEVGPPNIHYNSIKQTKRSSVQGSPAAWPEVNYACCNPLLLRSVGGACQCCWCCAVARFGESPVPIDAIPHRPHSHRHKSIISNSICTPKPISYYPALYRMERECGVAGGPLASPETPNTPIGGGVRPHDRIMERRYRVSKCREQPVVRSLVGECIQIGIQKAIHQCSFSAISIINHEKRSYDFIPTTNFNHLL